MARILAFANTFDAMLSDRSYRRKMTTDEIMKEIIALSGKQFDPRVVVAFEQWISRRHPVSLP